MVSLIVSVPRLCRAKAGTRSAALKASAGEVFVSLHLRAPWRRMRERSRAPREADAASPRRFSRSTKETGEWPVADALLPGPIFEVPGSWSSRIHAWWLT
jgi:hypothetical protein